MSVNFLRIGLVAVVAMGALALVPLEAGAQQVMGKVGFVDVDEIVQKLPEFKSIENQLQTLQKAYQDTLMMYQQQFQERLESYQKQQALMNPETKAKEEAAINFIREQALRFQQERLGQQGTYAQTQARLLQPVREKVRAAIERIAKEEKLAAVFESSMTIFYDPKLDITFKVLDYLKRG